jgi:hypothetical protein
LNGGFGGSVIYIEAGGTFENIGGGSNLIFVKAGGSYIGNGGGGGNNIFYETGATLSEGLTGTQLNNITIASIPEPSSAILIGLTSLVFAAQRRRIQFKKYVS